MHRINERRRRFRCRGSGGRSEPPSSACFAALAEYQELVDALGRLLEQDDDTDDQAVAMAEAMVSVLIYDAMTRRFFDRRSGALRQFADKLRKAVDSFEANIR